MSRFFKAGIKSVGQIIKGNLLLSIKELVQNIRICTFYQFLVDITIVFEDKFDLLYNWLIVDLLLVDKVIFWKIVKSLMINNPFNSIESS